MQSYLLDLPTLLQILARQRHSGALLSRGVHLRGFKQEATIRIDILEGHLARCVVSDSQSGHILADGNKAYLAVVGIGAVEWQWHTMVAPQVLQTRALPSLSQRRLVEKQSFATIVPWRTGVIRPDILGQLPRYQKHVLQMVDGVRSAEKIATLLLIEPEEIVKILRELQQMKLIIIHSSVR